MSIKISIIIPIYNGERYIENVINRVLNQTCPVHELIIVDDGSTDNTYQICEKYAEKYDIIKLIRTPNRGSGPARTTGIHNSTGSYLYFPDADDDFSTKLIEIIQLQLEKNKADLIVFGYNTIYPDGKKEKKYYNSFFTYGDKIRNSYFDFCIMEAKYGIQGAPWNKIFKKSIIVDNNIVFPPLRRHQDEAFISNYVNYVNTVCFLPDVLYTYYANDPNLEWKKFPADYEASVIGLINSQKNTILSWNKNDKKTHILIGHQLFCKSIKACENLLSPKQGNISTSKIKNNIQKYINELYISECPIEVKKQLGLYHRIAFSLAKKNEVQKLLLLIRIKVFIDNHYRLRCFLRSLFRSRA